MIPAASGIGFIVLLVQRARKGRGSEAARQGETGARHCQQNLPLFRQVNSDSSAPGLRHIIRRDITADAGGNHQYGTRATSRGVAGEANYQHHDDVISPTTRQAGIRYGKIIIKTMIEAHRTPEIHS